MSGKRVAHVRSESRQRTLCGLPREKHVAASADWPVCRPCADRLLSLIPASFVEHVVQQDIDAAVAS